MASLPAPVPAPHPVLAILSTPGSIPPHVEPKGRPIKIEIEELEKKLVAVKKETLEKQEMILDNGARETERLEAELERVKVRIAADVKETLKEGERKENEIEDALRSLRG